MQLVPNRPYVNDLFNVLLSKAIPSKRRYLTFQRLGPTFQRLGIRMTSRLDSGKCGLANGI